MQSEPHHDFLKSAATDQNPFMGLTEFQTWFNARREAHRFKIEQIPFQCMDKWTFEPTTGNLVHATGRFFKIEGVWVETNYGHKGSWTQPIINQPEIGILGLLARRYEGILYFLMQAKMEPGNLNMIQLAPTLQATRSNFTLVHKGQTPPYLEYFLDASRSRIMVDILQSEQGARFFRKRNRNMVVEVHGDIPVMEDYCWLTLGQVAKLCRQDNLVNMDARTVLSCIRFDAKKLQDRTATDALDFIGAESSKISRHASELLVSALDTKHAKYSSGDIIRWLTQAKFRYDLNVERMPLKYVQEWTLTKESISHRDGKYFSVIAVRVEADNREVAAWTQPMVKPREVGIVAFIMKHIQGVLHVLVQAKVEAGNFDVVEIAPTVQCLTGSYRSVPMEARPPFLDYVLQNEGNGPRVRFRGLQSEEGGRFFREENLNLVIEAEESFEEEVPPDYIWMTVRQLKTFIQYNNFVNVQARCLLASCGLL